MGVAIAIGLAAALAAEYPQRDIPFHPPSLKGDPAVMALAAKAVGKACQWRQDEYGPHVPGFTSLTGVGQTQHPQGAVIVRRRGAQRVAFMVFVDDKHCRILDVQPLPAKSPREAFEQCSVPDPRPDVNTPIADGLGLHQNGAERITYFLEADFKARSLIQRDPVGDPRYACSGFESGD